MVPARTMLMVLAGGAILAALAIILYRSTSAPATLDARLATIHVPDVASSVACPSGADVKPLMILALGQSNAGNHGESPAHSTPPAAFFYDGHCYLSAGPVPGVTGQGGSLWPYLSPLLSARLGRPVIFSVLAVDATSIADWADDTGLRARLKRTIREGIAHGFVPELVLWQQGEADARNGLSATVYREKLGILNAYIRRELGHTTMVVAQSTRCRNEGSFEIRSALSDSALAGQGIVIGPDTDALKDEFRLDGCHFSLAGLKAAASLWASVIVSTLTVDEGKGTPVSLSEQGKLLKGG